MINVLLLIDEYIILIAYGFNWFNVACDFNTKDAFIKKLNIDELKCS